MTCFSPLKGFQDKDSGGICFKRGSNAGKDMEVACGQCLGCRLDRSKEWAARMVHEASLYDDNIFITLTYRPKSRCTPEQLARGLYEPEDGSLRKQHFQKFMKRLRSRFPGKQPRYYHCGEYGDQLDRPHYHAILFNFTFQDGELFKENDGDLLFTSKLLEDIWGYGFCTFSYFSFETAAYCARYVLKKVNGIRAHDHYLRFDENGVCYWLEPEYATMSRRPGIGKDWYDKYKDDVFPSDECPVPGKGVFKKVPRYYETILEAEDPISLEQIKRIRAKFYEENKEEYSSQRLMDKYKVKKAQLTQLKRELI